MAGGRTDALGGTIRAAVIAELENVAVGTDAIGGADTSMSIDGRAVVDRLIERLGSFERLG